MDLYLRDLIDGMLQKFPSSRYDWDKITNHIFMRPKVVLAEINIEPLPTNDRILD